MTRHALFLAAQVAGSLVFSVAASARSFIDCGYHLLTVNAETGEIHRVVQFAGMTTSSTPLRISSDHSIIQGTPNQCRDASGSPVVRGVLPQGSALRVIDLRLSFPDLKYLQPTFTPTIWDSSTVYISRSFADATEVAHEGMKLAYRDGQLVLEGPRHVVLRDRSNHDPWSFIDLFLGRRLACALADESVLYCYRTETGELLWEWRHGQSLPAGPSLDVQIAELADGVLVATSFWGLYKIDHSGKLLWHLEYSNPYNAPEVFVSRDFLLVGPVLEPRLDYRGPTMADADDLPWLLDEMRNPDRASRLAAGAMLASLYRTGYEGRRIAIGESGAAPGEIFLSLARAMLSTGEGPDQRGGIGINTTVSSLWRGMAAERAGILLGDTIVEIDGMRVDAMEPYDIAPALRGPPGKSVRLTIERDGTADRLVFDVVRKLMFPSNETALYYIRSFLKDPDPTIRESALRSFLDVAQDARSAGRVALQEEARASLIEALKDERASIRNLAASVLKRDTDSTAQAAWKVYEESHPLAPAELDLIKEIEQLESEGFKASGGMHIWPEIPPLLRARRYSRALKILGFVREMVFFSRPRMKSLFERAARISPVIPKDYPLDTLRALERWPREFVDALDSYFSGNLERAHEKLSRYVEKNPDDSVARESLAHMEEELEAEPVR